MKKLLLLAAILLPFFVSAQTKKYWVLFKDKNNSPYSLTSPSDYLSQRAIDRRTRQHIALDNSDLPVNPAYVTGVLSKGVTVLNKSKWFNAVIIEADSLQLLAVQSLSYVKSTNRVARLRGENSQKHFFELEKSIIPQETSARFRISSKAADYGLAFNQIDMLNGLPLHNAGLRGKGIIIAVLDAGFNNADNASAFDSLRANGQILATHDFVTGGSSVYEDDAHGMEVLSTMGGNIPGQLIGTSPDASFLLLRSEDANTENVIEECNWVCAAEYADSAGADIITSSLGYTTFDNYGSGVANPSNHSYSDMNGHSNICTIGANTAFDKGMLVLCSAGNEGTTSWHYIGSPADGDNVLAIGGVDKNRNVVGFSSRGPSSDGDVKPDVCARAYQAVGQKPNGAIDEFLSGTSFSCPIMTGMAACLWQSNPGKTSKNLYDAIRQSGSIYPNHNDSLGYGIPDFNKAMQLLSQAAVSGLNEILISSNPFDNQGFKIIFNSENSQVVNIHIYNTVGMEVFNEDLKVYKGKNTISILGDNDLGKGIYILSMETTSGIMSKKIISRK